ncbi:hypothetical protein QF037_008936 [Streptomyces canus]|uniref:hypothetical protein n=1 Tax=Streptomyces canus TaxID=58343 RepID=UPI0027837A6E|nr:hypothetical protein [Streptomyces canus]MDQ0604591.1 hypothetical protein [Streptomyces canus]
MTVEVRKTIAASRPETGWARARRLRGRGIRTYVPATIDDDTGQLRDGADGNVVRGED